MSNCTCDVDIVDLSKDVAAVLSKEFGEYFIAKHNSQVIYDIADLWELHVDVYPVNLSLETVLRRGQNREYALHVAIQQRAASQEAEDLLSRLSSRVLEFLVRRRYLSGKVFSLNGSFITASVFDKVTKYKENVFFSLMEINFKQWA